MGINFVAYIFSQFFSYSNVRCSHLYNMIYTQCIQKSLGCKLPRWRHCECSCALLINALCLVMSLCCWSHISTSNECWSWCDNIWPHRAHEVQDYLIPFTQNCFNHPSDSLFSFLINISACMNTLRDPIFSHETYSMWLKGLWLIHPNQVSLNYFKIFEPVWCQINFKIWFNWMCLIRLLILVGHRFLSGMWLGVSLIRVVCG